MPPDNSYRRMGSDLLTGGAEKIPPCRCYSCSTSGAAWTIGIRLSLTDLRRIDGMKSRGGNDGKAHEHRVRSGPRSHSFVAGCRPSGGTGFPRLSPWLT